MNNFRKDFIAKKGSCFKMEQRSPLGKVEGGEDEDPVNESKTNNPFKGSKKIKRNPTQPQQKIKTKMVL